jgi:hypothetical protein
MTRTTRTTKTTAARRSPIVVAAAAMVSASLLVAACGSDDDARRGGSRPSETAAAHTSHTAAPPGNVVEFAARDFGFDGPKQVPAGVTELRLANHGRVDHQLALFRMKDGVAAATVLGALQAGGLDAGKQYGAWIAGPNGTAAAHTTSVVTDLQPGKYLVACFIPDEHGTPHAALGMLTDLTVTPASAPADHGAHEQTTGDEIVLRDYSFALPKGFGGRGSYDVVNRGTAVHEAVVVRLHDGTTVGDAIAYERGPVPRTAPPPYEMVSGTTIIDPGGRARLDLDLSAGRYAWLCFVPGPGGAPHLALGMAHPFTVR